jgi:hypothetical protein
MVPVAFVARDRGQERRALVRARRGGEDLRVEVLLHERLHDRLDAGHVRRADDHHVRLQVGDLVGTRLVGGVLRREDLGVHRLDAGLLQDACAFCTMGTANGSSTIG